MYICTEVRNNTRNIVSLVRRDIGQHSIYSLKKTIVRTCKAYEFTYLAYLRNYINAHI